MFELHDIRQTRVWREAYEEGIKKGIKKGIEKAIEVGRTLEQRNIVARLKASGQTQKEIAQLLGISSAEVRRLLGR